MTTTTTITTTARASVETKRMTERGPCAVMATFSRGRIVAPVVDPLRTTETRTYAAKARFTAKARGTPPSRVAGRRCIMYAYNRYICCEGTVRPKLPSGLWRCCGSSSYDAQLGICCQGTVYWRPSSSYECCGSLLYNRDIQTCVDGRVQMTGECTCDASSIAIQATTVSPLQSTTPRRRKPGHRPDRRTTTGLPQL